MTSIEQFPHIRHGALCGSGEDQCLEPRKSLTTGNDPWRELVQFGPSRLFRFGKKQGPDDARPHNGSSIAADFGATAVKHLELLARVLAGKTATGPRSRTDIAGVAIRCDETQRGARTSTGNKNWHVRPLDGRKRKARFGKLEMLA